MPRVQQRRGLNANLPSSNMLAGELLLTTDLHTIHFAIDATTKAPLVPAVADLSAIGAVNGTEDLLLLWDVSEAAGVKAKKITADAFKTWLNIPAGGTDEKVAVISGGAAGYLWGTDGTDGVLRMGGSMTWTKDAGNAFATLNVDVVDCGTF